MYGYKINPVKATCAKYGANCDIAKFNNTCYDICAGFSGTTDPYNMDPICTKTCDDYVEKQRVSQFGVGKCDHQAPYYPVIWNQVPHYVPSLLKNMSPQQALVTCKKMCVQYLPNLTQECFDKCDLDYNAIENFQDIAGITIKPEKRPEIDVQEDSSSNGQKSTVVLLIVFFIILVAFFVYMRTRK